MREPWDDEDEKPPLPGGITPFTFWLWVFTSYLIVAYLVALATVRL